MIQRRRRLGPEAGTVRAVILFVCTGNICRSPMAEGLLREILEAAGSELEVASAGTYGADAEPASGHAIRVLADRGIDIGAHRSRRLTCDLVDEADLVVAMTRSHEVAVATLDQTARSRTFLAGEVVRLGGQAGARGVGDLVPAWAEALHAARGGHMTTGRLADEVADPYGGSEDGYRRTADRLDGICSALARLLEP